MQRQKTPEPEQNPEKGPPPAFITPPAPAPQNDADTVDREERKDESQDFFEAGARPPLIKILGGARNEDEHRALLEIRQHPEGKRRQDDWKDSPEAGSDCSPLAPEPDVALTTKWRMSCL